MAQAAESRPTLYQRLSSVMDEIGTMAPTGTNSFQKYRFIESSMIAATVRPLLVKHGVVIIPEVLAHHFRQADGAKQVMVVIDMQFTLVNAENPEDRFIARWASEAGDTGDKALNKAVTAGTKYFMMKQFLISDKDEPDADAEDNSPQPQRQQPQPHRQGTQAPQRQGPQQAVAQRPQGAPTPMHPSTGLVVGTVQANDNPPPVANKRFYTDPQTGDMVPAPTPVAQRLYAALRQQAEAESMNTIDPANLLTAEDMNGATNNLVAELAARTVDDAGSPTAEELKDLTDLFRAYDGARVKLLTPEKRTAGVVRWLIATLTAVRNDVKKRAKAPEAAVA